MADWMRSQDLVSLTIDVLNQNFTKITTRYCVRLKSQPPTICQNDSISGGKGRENSPVAAV